MGRAFRSSLEVIDAYPPRRPRYGPPRLAGPTWFRALRFGAGAGGRGRQQRGRLEPRWRHRPAGAAGVSGCRQRGVSAYRYLAAVLETLAAEGLGEGSKVVIIHVDTGFGREVAEGAAVRPGDSVSCGGRSLFGQPGPKTCWRRSRRAMCCYRPVPSTMTSPSRSGSANAVGAQLDWSPPESMSSGTPSVIALRGFTDRASGSTTEQMIPRTDPQQVVQPLLPGREQY